jgi:hypothetical protein
VGTGAVVGDGSTGCFDGAGDGVFVTTRYHVVGVGDRAGVTQPPANHSTLPSNARKAREASLFPLICAYLQWVKPPPRKHSAA